MMLLILASRLAKFLSHLLSICSPADRWAALVVVKLFLGVENFMVISHNNSVSSNYKTFPDFFQQLVCPASCFKSSCSKLAVFDFEEWKSDFMIKSHIYH